MNTKFPLYDSSGRLLFAVGGAQAWKTHDCHGYNVSMEWVDGEPAMVIWSRLAPDFGFAICLSSVGKYATPEGKPNQEGVDALAMALPDFGREICARELHRLVDIVLRYVPELIAMPPTPRDVRKADAGGAIWDVTQKANDKTISEASI